MLELLFCALFTILPDYLIKHYVYKKRWGKEINFFSMWYELRWGISACVLLTIALITLVFYYHPSTANVTILFRTVTVLPESSGRVKDVFVENLQMVQKGDPLFSLDSARQKAAVETARRSLEELAAELTMAKASLQEAEGEIASNTSRLSQAKDDLQRALQIARAGKGVVSERNVVLARNKVVSTEGELASAVARRDEVLVNLNTLLPARQKTAEAELKETLIELQKTVVYSAISGRVTQFILQPGDIVNPMMRPAGFLVPSPGDSEMSGRQAVQAGFNQLASQVVKQGTVAEITCLSKPFTIIPMVVTDVQTSIAAGQLRPTDQMIDLQDRIRPGTLTARLEPLYPGGLDGVIPGSKCIANAYSNYHEVLESGELGTGAVLYYHMVDTVALVHALLLRIQALVIPIQNLVFAGH